MSMRKINNNFNVIYKNLKIYRKSKKMSQADLARELNLLGINIHKNDIYLIEANLRTVRDYEIWGFLKILNITFEELTNGIEEKIDY